MEKRLGRAYYGFVAACGVAVIAASGVGAADASEPIIVASGYGADTTAPQPVSEDAREGAIDTCLTAAAERYDADVRLAHVNRAWEGTEGWIVDLSLDVAREGKRPRRRDALCRESEHGLQVARY